MAHIIEDEPTHFPLLDLPSHEGKDEKHVDHDFYYNVSDFCRRWESDICPKSYEEIFDAFKEVNNCALAGTSGQNRLEDLGINATEKNNFTSSAQKGEMKCP